MDHIMIANFDASDTHHMRIYSIPIPNSYIMSDNRVGLDEIVISYLRIGSNGSESPHHISYSHFYI